MSTTSKTNLICKESFILFRQSLDLDNVALTGWPTIAYYSRSSLGLIRGFQLDNYR